MRRAGRNRWFVTSPVFVGALTVLVVIVAVVLAYGANTGLPFVPSYDLHVQIKNASELQKGDDIEMGGALIGLVNSITPSRTRSGDPVAVMNLKLYKNVEPLPRTTRFTVRLKGAIGLKYLSVSKGRGRGGYANGATVPLGHAGSSVDFDQVLDMFTPKTRKGVQDSTIGLAQAVTGRGYDLNQAIGQFRPLLTALAPVAANLASSRTDLAGFLRGLSGFSTALAPVAQAQADLFANLDTTFTALAGVSPQLQQTITDTPPLFEATIDDSPQIRPFLTDAALLFRQLRPAVATLPELSPTLTDTFAIGKRTLPQTEAIDTQLVKLAARLKSYGLDPEVTSGLSQLTRTAGDLRQPLRFLAPVQSTCNYVTLFLRNTSSVLSEHTSSGALLRFVQVAITDLPGRESEPSQKLFTGGVQESSGPVHSDPYPNTASPGQLKECSAGREPFVKGAQIGNPPINVGDTTQQTKSKLVTTSTTATTSATSSTSTTSTTSGSGK